MAELRQRNVAITWQAVVLVALPIAALAAGVVWNPLPTTEAMLWMIIFFPMLLVGLGDCLWYAGADLRIDDNGIFFGTLRQRSRPPTVSYLARTPYTIPWQAARSVRLVAGRRAARAMRKAARPNWTRRQPTQFYGYFPVRFRRCHLVVEVTIPPASYQRIDEFRSRFLGDIPPRGNPVWVFPVRNPDAVRQALRGRLIFFSETTEAALPRTCS